MNRPVGLIAKQQRQVTESVVLLGHRDRVRVGTTGTSRRGRKECIREECNAHPRAHSRQSPTNLWDHDHSSERVEMGNRARLLPWIVRFARKPEPRSTRPSDGITLPFADQERRQKTSTINTATNVSTFF